MNVLEKCPGSCGYTVRLAKNADEVRKAQKLRYKSMVLDYNPLASPDGIDYTPEDEYCDHLIAVKDDTGEIVGNYRLLNSQQAKENNAPFICEREFDISALKNLPDGILEIGRAVVDPEHRNAPIIKLLWQGLLEYCTQFNIRYLFGTASFHPVSYNKDDAKHFAYAQAFSYLAQNHLISPELNCPPREPNIPFEDMVKAFPNPDREIAKEQTPALIRTYLAMGASVSNGAYMDNEYHVPSIDCMVVIDLQKINLALMHRMFGVRI